jgi:hypothetical protein
MKLSHLFFTLGIVVLTVVTRTESRIWPLCANCPKPLGEIPSVVIWAWEHNDNLEFVDPSKVAVAYYAGTIMMGRSTATLVRRSNKIQLSTHLRKFPVFRIQNCHPQESAPLAAWHAAQMLISAYMQEHSDKVVQIDCDAGRLDRQGYLRFLQELRKELPKDTALSITALASWCLADKWLQSAPVDETVAMIISLGKRRAQTMSVISRDGLSTGNAAVESLGIAINEEDNNRMLQRLGCIRKCQRIYVFSPLGWTKARYESVLAHLRDPQ